MHPNMKKHLIPVSVNHIDVHHRSLVGRDASASCTTGGFYTSPTAGQVVNSSNPFTISWDSSCLDTQKADIYLYAPNANQTQIQIFDNVPFGAGSYQTTLQPKWWNDTQSVSLLLKMVPSGTPVFLATLPAGPIFTATYTPPANGVVAADADTSGNDSNITQNADPSSSNSSSKGKIAAGILVPMLVIALATFAFIKYKRVKRAKKAQRFSQAVDKRMSTISTNWRAMSYAGADAAVRASMVFTGERASTVSFGNRASSTLAVESGQAGIGAQGLEGDEGDRDTSQIRRPGVGPRSTSSSASSGAPRVSRISFAADTRFSRAGEGKQSLDGRGRPSLEGRRAGAATRSFHTSFVPPVPVRRPSETESDDAGAMSPTQTQGPFALSPEDIQARMSGQFSEMRPSFDNYMPALSMMRTGTGEETDAENGSDMLLSPRVASPTFSGDDAGQYLAFPAPPPAVLKSPIVDVMPMQPMPANVMSPDEMLRAYAEQRAMNVGTPTYPAPVAGGAPTTMRTLYSPAASSTAFTVPVGSNNPFRMSMMTPEMRTDNGEHNEDAYGGAI